MIRRRAAVVLLALALDGALGELPNRLHPVAWMGRAIARGEAVAARAPSAQVIQGVAGVMLLATFAGAAWKAGAIGSATSRSLPGFVGLGLEAALLKQAFALRALLEHASAVESPLLAGDFDAARAAVGRMVSRPTAELGGGLVASAALESLSENFSDSVVAPLAWYLAGGLPAAFTYRAVNTLDAMVGYRSRGWFGTPSARADDVLNFVPARLTAALYAFASGRPRVTLSGARGDSRATPSPNSGWPMAALAHALAVRFEKPGHHIVNGSASLPVPTDLRRGRTRTLIATGLLAFALAAVPFAPALRGWTAPSPAWRGYLRLASSRLGAQ